MNDHSEQTDPPDRSATVAFRTSKEQKHLLQAVASRRDCLPSDWLRDLLRSGLQRELEGSPDIGCGQT